MGETIFGGPRVWGGGGRGRGLLIARWKIPVVKEVKVGQFTEGKRM